MKTPPIRGFLEIEYIDKDTGEVFHRESPEAFDAENLVVNYFRSMLPALLAPRTITGRANNDSSLSSWLDRRLCLVGFGIGDGADPGPTVKPEEPEDGRGKLVGEDDYPYSKKGLQWPIRRIPLTADGPSEGNDPNNEINGFYLLKEVDSDGIEITQVANGGAELALKFTISDDEYIGNIMEYGLYFGGGDAGSSSIFEVEPGSGVYDVERLSRENAIMAARKTRNKPIEKTRGYKFRLTWRIRT